MTIWPGRPYPLGANWDGAGTNFSVFSGVAEQVELCLFDENGSETRLDLPEEAASRWHGYVPGVGPGQRYGFRVHGRYEPVQGLRCNPAKLLLDPYAKAIEGRVSLDPAIFAYQLGAGGEDLTRSDTDSGAFVPRSVVCDAAFEWQGDRLLQIPWHETLIYEAHVKGFTATHPDIPPQLRGTYAGLGHPAAIGHFRALGVTSVELMPVHQFCDPALERRGLANYWGYNSVGYFAPHNAYSSAGQRGQQVLEFKEMVKSLHAGGIEVILDVVYNHTAEGNQLGPTLCFRGFDNQAYYRLLEGQPRYYADYVGVGNTVNARHPHVLQLIMDSLRYWVLEMHVDGFRFDAAAALARELHDVDRLSAFFDLIQQDPVVSQVKLIAEPWDLGDGGYQVGNFPALWSEWNGRYRDTVRDYWRGTDRTLSDLAYRLTGSSDLYESSGRRPCASINFTTAHDGFSLEDLVSYDKKHNEANGEENRDGTDDNRSWNCGVEGPTYEPGVLLLRARQKRNLLATLFLSQGVPMLLSGDELGRTQQGNNNAYCQDNEISWIDWDHRDKGLEEFTKGLGQLRRQHPVFRRHRWFQGRPIHGADTPDIAWFAPSGVLMSEENWGVGFARALEVFLNGGRGLEVGPTGEPVVDDSFLLLVNADVGSMKFRLPASQWGRCWVKVLDTGQLPLDEEQPPHGSDTEIDVMAHCLMLFRLVTAADPQVDTEFAAVPHRAASASESSGR